MRKATFTTLGIVLFWFVDLAIRALLDLQDWNWITYLGTALVGGTILGLGGEFILKRLNVKLLEYRKAQGRDIEDEERYESDLIDHGMISLNPRQEISSKNGLEK